MSYWKNHERILTLTLPETPPHSPTPSWLRSREVGFWRRKTEGEKMGERRENTRKRMEDKEEDSSRTNGQSRGPSCDSQVSDGEGRALARSRDGEEISRHAFDTRPRITIWYVVEPWHGPVSSSPCTSKLVGSGRLRGTLDCTEAVAPTNSRSKNLP
nr:uncharacterized protein LOC129033564 isoform X1 [Pongo pygmaeus]